MAFSSVSSIGNTSYYPSSRPDTIMPGISGPGKDSSVQGGTARSGSGNSGIQGIGEKNEPAQTYSYLGKKPDKSTSNVNGSPENKSTENDGKTSETKGTGNTPKKKDGSEYTRQELKEISELKSRDTEVKAHEQAHIAAGGKYVRSGAHYEYQTGPDGNKYAVGGEVNIDTSKESGDPQGTITKMQTVIRAALAPAEPSAQDRSVAAQAEKTEMEAQSELMKTQSDKALSTMGSKDSQDSKGNSGYASSSGYNTSKKANISVYA